MKKYTILYVDDCNPKHISFKTKKQALKFVSDLTSKLPSRQDITYIDGLVIGEYVKAELDYIENKIIKKLKEKK